MSKIVTVISNLFDIASSFIPAPVFFIAIPFVALMAFMKIIREVH